MWPPEETDEKYTVKRDVAERSSVPGQVGSMVDATEYRKTEVVAKEVGIPEAVRV